MAKSVFYTNGKFYTGESVMPDSLFCYDGKIVAIGSHLQMTEYKEKADEVIDMKEMFAYPDFCGFIEEVEYDCSENGEDMLNLYDKKMAKKVLADEIDMYLKVGDVCNFAGYNMDLIKNTTIQRFPPARRLIVNGELFYDEEAFEEEQFFWLMASQQF